MNQTMAGKTVLVTGANSGIGYATAVGLASMGANVIMVARNREKGEAARAEIMQATGNNTVDLLLADLSSVAQVKQLATTVLQRYPRLDVLINNAAIVLTKRTLTTDGLETQFMVNHLSYFLLANQLLPLLQAAGRGRIINVSSNLHAGGVVEFDNLQGERSYPLGFGGPGWGQYGNTKLMNILFTYEMARRLPVNSVTVNALHPGIIGTNLSRMMPGPIHAMYKMVMPKPEQGAKTSLYLATSPEVEGISGRYYVNSQPAPSSDRSHDLVVAKQLWDVSSRFAEIDTIGEASAMPAAV